MAGLKSRFSTKRIVSQLLTAIFILSSLSTNVSAIDDTYDQQFFAGNDILYYNPSTCSTSDTSTGDTTSPTGNGIYSIVINNPRGGKQYHSHSDTLSMVDKAHDGPYYSIDIDINRSTDGVLYAAHKPGLPGKTWAQVHKEDPSAPLLSDMLKLTVKYNLQANLDIKPWGNVWNDAAIAQIANLANSLNAKATVKASTNDKKLANGLNIARNHGFWVRANEKPYDGNGWKAGVWVKPPTMSGATPATISDTPDTCTCPASDVSSASLIGGTSLEKAYNYLVGKGLSPQQAAGAIGNMAAESNGDSTVIQGGHGDPNQDGTKPIQNDGHHTGDPSSLTTRGHAYGLIQWDPGAKLINLLKQANITNDIKLLSTQLDMVWWHVNHTTPTGYTGFLEQYKKITNVDAAAEFWQAKMEGTTNDTAGRQKGAELALAQYSGSLSTSSASSTLSSANQCGSTDTGAVTGNIVQTAMNYAWPSYHEGPYLNAKPAYMAAIKKAQAAGKYVGGLSNPGIDCGGFITRVMQDSGVDPNYGGGGNTTVQLNYLKSHPDLYKQINPSSTADLQPGDIAIKTADGGHTYMYIGKQSGFQTSVVSASVAISNPNAWRAPMAGMEKPADPAYQWFRHIGNGGETDNV